MWEEAHQQYSPRIFITLTHIKIFYKKRKIVRKREGTEKGGYGILLEQKHKWNKENEQRGKYPFIKRPENNKPRSPFYSKGNLGTECGWKILSFCPKYWTHRPAKVVCFGKTSCSSRLQCCWKWSELEEPNVAGQNLKSSGKGEFLVFQICLAAW